MDVGRAGSGVSLTDLRFSRIDRFMPTRSTTKLRGKYGNCHIAFGSSYADTYGRARRRSRRPIRKKLGFSTALHWDLSCTRAQTGRRTGHGKRVVISDNVGIK
jgi:aminopeptidase